MNHAQPDYPTSHFTDINSDEPDGIELNSEPVKKVQKKKVLVDTAIVDDDDNGDDIDIDNDNDPEWNPEDAD